MTYKEYADTINKTLIVKYIPNGAFCARFEDCEVKDGAFLLGTCGRGETAQLAIEDYFEKIEGETLVFKAYHKNRMEFMVPSHIKV